MKLSFVATSGLLVSAFLAPGQTPTKAPAAKRPASSTTTAAKRPPAAASRGNLMNPASLNAKAPDQYKVKFATTKGDVMIQVTRSWSPLGADRFYNLVKNGFFTNIAFYRIVPGFVVQFGFSGRPELSKVWERASIQDDPVTQSNRRGTLTFATSGPNTRTTQLFINIGENQRLDGMGFSPFGEVISGMDIVDKFNQEYGERPEQPMIASQGAAYLNKEFPNLDSIKTATIVTDTAAPAVNKPATNAMPKPKVYTPPKPATNK